MSAPRSPAPEGGSMLERRNDTMWVAVTSEVLDTGAAISFLHTPDAGGIDLFIGTTRQWTHGRETTELAYESYSEMAIQEMERLAARARARWPVLKICILHRVGTVPIAQASVVVGVATPHRADAFEACRFLIDTLKEDVPIWKFETYADGTSDWVDARGKV